MAAGASTRSSVRSAARRATRKCLCTPGNAGIAREARIVEAGGDVASIVDAARDEGAGLVVVGPEAPLVDGAVDALAEAGITAFGPSAAAARIEGSKLFAKELMAAAGVPTAEHAVLADAEAARDHLAEARFPLVLKADGLAAGKGVIICESEDEALEALDVFFAEQRFGETAVFAEEHLEGAELSMLAICDGENVVPLAPAQDYKRIFDGDRGPNTGGMGSYSPVPGFDEARVAEIVEGVHRPIVAEMARRGTPFHGVLYAGLMLGTGRPEGARVQLPLRRSRDPGGAAAPALGSRLALRGRRRRPAASPASARSSAPIGRSA